MSGAVPGDRALWARARLCCGLHRGGGWFTSHLASGLPPGAPTTGLRRVTVMSDFLADLQSYFAAEDRAREAELADARPALDHAEYADRPGRLRRAMSEAGTDVVLLSRP